MRLVILRVVALIGFAGTGSAMLLPWAQYGDIDIALTRFPWWWVYAACAVALQLAVAWRLVRDGRRVRITGVALGVATVAATVLVAVRYDDAPALFDTFIPLVFASIGIGAVLA